MIVNSAHSVSQALSHGLHNIRVHGVAQPSRVGDVLVSTHPVMTVYLNPLNRVLFSPMRDANPFFHVMESLWMLAGRNDLPWLAQYNRRMLTYSDDGGRTQPGAYGFRWREHFGYDQLDKVIMELRNNPKSRRCVIAMWDPSMEGDLDAAISGSADVPCNTHIYMDTIGDKLNMTVCCRSNDIYWGAHGANAVHFSFLLEYLAAKTDIPMGVVRQFSNNYHIYTNIVAYDSLMPLAREVDVTDLYMKGDVLRELSGFGPIIPLVTTGMATAWEEELEAFMNEEERDFSHQFFSLVAVPMRKAWKSHKERNYDDAILHAEGIRSKDWQVACMEWLHRRKIKHEVNKVPFTEVIKDC